MVPGASNPLLRIDAPSGDRREARLSGGHDPLCEAVGLGYKDSVSIPAGMS